MSEIRDGGPAFARPSVDPKGKAFDWEIGSEGMSLRDWFAGQALVGYLAMHAAQDASGPPPTMASEWSYKFADAMIAAREKSK